MVEHYKTKLANKRIKEWTGLDNEKKAYMLYEMDIVVSGVPCNPEPCELCQTEHRTRYYIYLKTNKKDVHTVGSSCIHKFPIDIIDKQGNVISDANKKISILKKKNREAANIRKLALRLVSYGENREKWEAEYKRIKIRHGDEYQKTISRYAKIFWKNIAKNI